MCKKEKAQLVMFSLDSIYESFGVCELAIACSKPIKSLCYTWLLQLMDVLFGACLMTLSYFVLYSYLVIIPDVLIFQLNKEQT